MSRNRIVRTASLAVLLFSAMLIPLAATTAAQKAAPEAPKTKTSRLPNYYARVASGQQQTELRAVMKQYAPQIQAKRKELQDLIGQRNAELDQILTAEQREQITKLRAAAAKRRQKAGKPKQTQASPDTAKAKKAG